MNILELENHKNQLIELLAESRNNRKPLLEIISFFIELIQNNDDVLIEAYTSELIDDLIQLLRNATFSGLPPTELRNIECVLNELLTREAFTPYHEQLQYHIQKIELELLDRELVLNGSKVNQLPSQQVFFPVLFIDDKRNTISGAIESISIILEESIENKFDINPSQWNSDKKIDKQVELAFAVAKKYCGKYISITRSFHAIVTFDNKVGDYVGESFGLSLTVGFIKALLEKFNTPYNIVFRSNIVATGGIDPNGYTKPVSNEIIGSKVETVFFSNTDAFVMHETDYQYALHVLSELKKHIREEI